MIIIQKKAIGVETETAKRVSPSSRESESPMVKLKRKSSTATCRVHSPHSGPNTLGTREGLYESELHLRYIDI